MDKVTASYISIFETVLKGRSLYFFGAGQVAKDILINFKYKKYLRGIFDNKCKRGGAIPDTSIALSNELGKIKSDGKVIISSFYYNNLSKQLQKLWEKYKSMELISDQSKHAQYKICYTGVCIKWD